MVANLQKGNVITAFQETPLTLNYRIADGNAKQVVKNDRFMPVLIMHFADMSVGTKPLLFWRNRNVAGAGVITFLIMLFATKLEFCLHYVIAGSYRGIYGGKRNFCKSQSQTRSKV